MSCGPPVSDMIGMWLLLLAGLAVYAGYGLTGFAYLIAAITGSYLAGLLIPKHRAVMWITVAVHGLILLFMKLQNVVGTSFLAPLGLSYFTLRVISYAADVYTGKIEPERDLSRYALYISFLPCIFLGPIETYGQFRENVLNRSKMNWDGISHGAVRILWGLFKKLVISTRAGTVVGAISADPGTYGGAYALCAMLMYSIQLYTDFSGGIDVVLGGCEMLGIRLSENFNTPYFSQSVQEFWRRWHITLGGWLRNYVYIPLGGSRKGIVRKYINTIVTFLVSGIWHGAEYLLWGLFNGIFVALGDRFKTRFKWVNIAGTFLVITFLWAFFVWPDTATAVNMIGSVFTQFRLTDFVCGLGNLNLNLGEWIVFGVSVLVLLGHDLWQGRLETRYAAMAPASRVAVICALGLVILVFGMYGIGFNAADFIYSQF